MNGVRQYITCWDCLFFTQPNDSETHPNYTLSVACSPCGWTVFCCMDVPQSVYPFTHCVDVPQSVYPFTHWRAVLLMMKRAAINMCTQGFVWHNFHFCRVNTYGRCMCNFIRHCKVSPQIPCTTCTLASTAGEFQWFCILLHLVLLKFFILASYSS